MKQLTNKKLLEMTPLQFADLIKRAAERREFRILFDSLHVVCKEEIDALLDNLFLPSPKKYVLDIVNPSSYLVAVASIYPTIAPTIRQAHDNRIIESSLNENTMLDVISLVYVSSIFPECATYTATPPKLFVIRNQKSLAFWQHYRSHLPYDVRFESFFEDFGFPLDFILPSIVISSPSDLHFYKVFCRELKAKDTKLYEHYKIESHVCKEMIKRLKQKESGITPEPQAVAAESVKNNILILDILR